MKLKYTGEKPTRYWHGGGSKRVEPGEIVDMPDMVYKARLKEKCWKKATKAEVENA